MTVLSPDGSRRRYVLHTPKKEGEVHWHLAAWRAPGAAAWTLHPHWARRSRW